LTISNRSGEDSAKFSIKVLDCPATPEPPMKATLEGNNCTLLWKKVKDDGGVPIEHYQVICCKLLYLWPLSVNIGELPSMKAFNHSQLLIISF
jgi:hypothetical protein